MGQHCVALLTTPKSETFCLVPNRVFLDSVPREHSGICSAVEQYVCCTTLGRQHCLVSQIQKHCRPNLAHGPEFDTYALNVLNSSAGGRRLDAASGENKVVALITHGRAAAKKKIINMVINALGSRPPQRSVAVKR